MNIRLLFAFVSLAFLSAGQEIVPGRFIVELSGEPAIGHRAPERRRAEIGQQHRSVEASMRARRVRILASTDTVANTLIVEAPDAASLAGMPGVVRVVPVRVLQPFLVKALANHEVAAAWDLSGGIEQAGAGMKIAILDTGVDTSHPGFQPPEGMSVPEGYPKANTDANHALTNAKVIVARSFDSGTVRDRDGHGTGVAMCAAGVRHESPRGILSGIAPAAWLGAYRVSNLDGVFYSDVVLQALDWAVKDGMDVINMSFGSVGAFGPEGDPVFEGGVRRALDNGIVVVNAAGNTPGPSTVDDTSAAELVISAGSNDSAGAVQVAVAPSVGLPMPAAVSSNVEALAPVMGPMVDAETLDNKLACTPFAPDSLTGRIPLIERGDCLFQEKLANAAAGGAAAAVVYNSSNPASGTPEDLVAMNVDGNPTIPALFVSRSDGLRLKELIATVEDFQAQLRFPNSALAPNRISSFSSGGPALDLRIKPDLLATGSSVYTAAVKAPASACDMCDPSGYLAVSGTSFSAPIISGATAALKAARPGLSLDEYRSLLINSTSAFKLSDGTIAPVMSAGAGMLNLKSAVSSTLAAAPVSLSYASGGGTVDKTSAIRLKHLGAEAAEYTLKVESALEARPSLSSDKLVLAPGAEESINLVFAAGGLAPGAYEGFVKVTNTSTSAETRIPYWYAVEGSAAGGIALLKFDPSVPRPGETVRIYFRVHDKAGLVLTEAAPVVTPVSGGGTVSTIGNASRTFPNSWVLTYRTGPQAGPNVFQIRVGEEVFTYQVTTGF